MRRKRSSTENVLKFYQRVRTKIYTLLIRNCFYSVGTNISITPPLRFGNLHQIQLGNRVTIHRDCWLLVLDENLSDSEIKIILEDNVSIGTRSCIHSAKKVLIKRDVIIAPNVYISDCGHEYNDSNKPIRIQGLRKIKPVIIGEGSWIGFSSIILPGVEIGKNCVIGANSVVNSNIPDYSVACGAPAKVVKQIQL